MPADLWPLIGEIAADCPKWTKPNTCDDCLHAQVIIDEYWHPQHNQYLAMIARTSLEEQNELLKLWGCGWSPETCIVGEWLRFPCIQCGLIVDPAFMMCAETIEACGTTYTVKNPCYSFCASVCNAECKLGEFDFRSTTTAFELYEKLIAALQLDVTASVDGVETVAQSIWADAVIVAFQDDVFYLSATLTGEELSIWPIISRVFPLPIGTKIYPVI